MIKTTVVFGEPAFFQPTRAFEYFVNCCDWLDKKPLLLLSCKPDIYLFLGSRPVI